jgi:DNA-binding FadR family transcriptional regulator
MRQSIAATRAAKDTVTFHRHAFDFHQIIVDSTQNRILCLVFGCLRDLVYRSFVRADVDEAWRQAKAEEHQRVYEAIEARDPDKAEHCLRSHLEGFEPIYSRYLDEHIERLV